jgi:hypothetical protein
VRINDDERITGEGNIIDHCTVQFIAHGKVTHRKEKEKQTSLHREEENEQQLTTKKVKQQECVSLPNIAYSRD